MLHSLVTISALTGMAVAQTSTIMDLFLPKDIFDGQSFVGSVVAAAPTRIEYFVTCPEGEDSDDCGLGPGVSVTMQPGTYALGLNMPPSFTMSERCEIDQETAICTASILGSEANDPGVETTTMTDVTTEDFFMPVTITAGLEKLAAATATATAAGGSTATPAQSASDGGSSVTSPPTAASQTGSGASTGAASSTGSVSTGAAAPCITRDAVLAGVVALVGGALAL
ncbi:hypothetical protein SLS62_001971 [Diatrype stigma]|uniref:GPI anchored protein n=1 Tax=Diatrype stigma TaxID=117547 RepID=A0AAN9UXB7_9PEZI